MLRGIEDHGNGVFVVELAYLCRWIRVIIIKHGESGRKCSAFTETLQEWLTPRQHKRVGTQAKRYLSAAVKSAKARQSAPRRRMQLF